MPTPAFRTGDFSALLGAQIGTDGLCRPILSGQIYDPFSTRPFGGGFIRDPVPGNNLATYISPLTGASLINPIGQKLINFYPAADQRWVGEQLECHRPAGGQFGRVQRPH